MKDYIQYESLSAYKESHPDVEIVVNHIETFDTEKYDFFFGPRNENPRKKLYCLPMHCIVPAKFPIASKPTLRVEDLAGYSVCIPLPEAQELITPSLFEALSGPNIQFVKPPAAPYEYTRLSITSSCICVIIGREADVPAPLVQIPLEGYFYEYYMYYAPRSIQNPVVKAYLDFQATFYQEYAKRANKEANP